jgi:RNA-directed DNA polymerase
MNTHLTLLASDAILDTAYKWLIAAKKDANPNNDVWILQERFAQEKVQIQQDLLNNTYQFEPVRIYEVEGIQYNVWTARDALVLKALAVVLGQVLQHKLPRECTNIKGHGGLKYAVRVVKEQYSNYKYVLKSDIAGYYANINHE